MPEIRDQLHFEKTKALLEKYHAKKHSMLQRFIRQGVTSVQHDQEKMAPLLA